MSEQMELCRENRRKRKATMLQRRSERSHRLGTEGELSLSAGLHHDCVEKPNQCSSQATSHGVQPGSSGLVDWPLDFGYPDRVCVDCGAMFWYEERIYKETTYNSPRFSLCCQEGKILPSAPNDTVDVVLPMPP